MTKAEKSADRVAQTNVGGVTPEKLQKTVEKMDSVMAKMSVLRGDLGSAVKDFEDAGGHKKALKTALMMKNMETDQARDYWKSLNAYMEELGVFAQHELFDSAPTVTAVKAIPPQRTADQAIAESMGTH